MLRTLLPSLRFAMQSVDSFSACGSSVGFSGFSTRWVFFVCRRYTSRLFSLLPPRRGALSNAGPTPKALNEAIGNGPGCSGPDFVYGRRVLAGPVEHGPGCRTWDDWAALPPARRPLFSGRLGCSTGVWALLKPWRALCRSRWKRYAGRPIGVGAKRRVAECWGRPACSTFRPFEESAVACSSSRLYSGANGIPVTPRSGTTAKWARSKGLAGRPPQTCSPIIGDEHKRPQSGHNRKAVRIRIVGRPPRRHDREGSCVRRPRLRRAGNRSPAGR